MRSILDCALVGTLSPTVTDNVYPHGDKQGSLKEWLAAVLRLEMSSI